MIEWKPSKTELEFDVQVGLMSVVVNGSTQAEAIDNARAKLSRELPLMWDVIYGLEESRFQVTSRKID